jgi:hypothetical protein
VQEHSERVFEMHPLGGRFGRSPRPILAGRYVDADSDVPTAACPAASRAVSTRNGEQLT